MCLATLEFTDFVIIAGIVALLSGGAVITAASRFLPSDRQRLVRTEQKLDMVLTHLGLEYTPPTYETWQKLANDPRQKIAAIKAYREAHGVGLAEAKTAVEQYISGGSVN